MSNLENREKFKQVAKLIGMKYDNGDNKYDHADTASQGALSVFVRYSPWNHKGKWHISASVARANKIYLRDEEKRELTLSINVSETKSAEQIAKDIEKRLMPSAKKYFELVSEKLASHDEYENAIVENCKAIQKVTGGKLPEAGQSSTMHFSKRDDDNQLDLYGNVQVMRDSCYLEIRNLPVEKAAEILKMLGVNND